MSSREEFEAWASKQKLGLTYGDCGYVFSSTEMAWRAWQVMEAKCSALAAENAALNEKMDKLATWPDIEFYSSSWEFNNGDGNTALEFMCDVQTPATDAFLAEVRAQGVEMVIAYHRERADALHHVDRNNAIRHSMAALDASDVAAKLRQEAAQ